MADEKKDNKTKFNLDPNRTPILYSDSIYITSNKQGLVLNIAQSMGSDRQKNVIARIGMSREHASELLEVLNKHLTLRHLKETGQNN